MLQYTQRENKTRRENRVQLTKGFAGWKLRGTRAVCRFIRAVFLGDAGVAESATTQIWLIDHCYSCRDLYFLVKLGVLLSLKLKIKLLN